MRAFLKMVLTTVADEILANQGSHKNGIALAQYCLATGFGYVAMSQIQSEGICFLFLLFATKLQLLWCHFLKKWCLPWLPMRF